MALSVHEELRSYAPDLAQIDTNGATPDAQMLHIVRDAPEEVVDAGEVTQSANTTEGLSAGVAMMYLLAPRSAPQAETRLRRQPESVDVFDFRNRQLPERGAARRTARISPHDEGQKMDADQKWYEDHVRVNKAQTQKAVGGVSVNAALVDPHNLLSY